MDNGQFGAPVGDIGQPLPGNLKNEYATIPDVSIADYARNNVVLPRDLSTGVMRGTQRIQNTDGSYITLGVIPDTDGEFGIAFFDSSGDLISKSTGVTDYKYDLTTNKNYYQNGLLPDGSYGAIFVKSGVNVVDVFN